MRGTGGTPTRIWGGCGLERGPGRVVAMTDLDLDAHGGGEGRNADPVEAAGAEGAGSEVRVRSYGDAVAVGVDGEDIERRGGADAQALALADGEVGDAVVTAEDFAIGGDQLAGGVGERAALLFHVGGEELLVVTAGDEADLLGVGLFGQGQAMLAGHFAHFGLGEAAEREQSSRELLLGEAEEEVGLVLGSIRGALEDPALADGVELVDGVVAGGDAACADGAGGLEQRVELEVVVAERAGDGRAAVEILVDEGADDILLEALLLVDDVVGNAEVLGDAAGVIDIIQGAAAAGLGGIGNAVLACEAGLVPELEGEADDGDAAAGLRIVPWASMAATVEESTPPDMATAMVAGLVMVSKSASQQVSESASQQVSELAGSVDSQAPSGLDCSRPAGLGSVVSHPFGKVRRKDGGTELKPCPFKAPKSNRRSFDFGRCAAFAQDDRLCEDQPSVPAVTGERARRCSTASGTTRRT